MYKKILHFFCSRVSYFPSKQACILVFVALLGLHATAYAQKITLKSNNTPLEDIFKSIRKQSGYNVFYNAEMLKATSPVSINVTNASVETVIRKCLEGTKLDFKIVDKNIIISYKLATAEKPQNKDITITGKVTDDKSIALPGVSIKIKNTNTAVITNPNGDYTIKVPDENSILVYSFLGFATQERAVAKNTVINISLKEQNQGLNEVVVVGYGEVNKRDLTGAVSSVNMNDIEKIPIVRVDQMLQGRIAGVDFVSTSGDPGAGTTVRIRGTRSINADNEPLYVVDGIIDAGDLNNINPADIESIQVLKDASSTAIYGSRGANGVILITTKKGAPGKDVIRYNSETGAAWLPKYLDMMNAREYAELLNENYWFNNPAGTNPPYPDAELLGEGTNWTKEVTRTAPYNNHSLSVSGGNTGLRYYLSGNYANQKGIIKASGFERYQTRLNLDKTFSQKLKGGIRLNYSSTNEDVKKVDIGSNAGWWNSTLAIPPVMGVFVPDEDSDSGEMEFEDWNPGWYAGGVINTPVALVSLMKHNVYKKNLWANLFLEYEPIKNLKIKTAFSNTNYFRNESRYEPGTLPRRAFLNAGGYAVKAAYTYEKALSETTISYAKSWQNKHSFNALGGFTLQRTKAVNQWQRAQGLLVDATEDNNMAAAEKEATAITSSLIETQMVSVLGRLNYDYGKRYYFTLTGRADGASNFPTGHKWAFFPSGAFKWAMLQEKWMKGLRNTLGEASLRLSYGVSGNQAIPAYGSQDRLTASSNGYLFNGSPLSAYTTSNIPNNNLTWETSSQWNAGLDLKLVNERISLTVDAYNTVTKDLLLTVQLPQQSGFDSRLVNLGKTQNKGLEFTLNTVNIQSISGLKWTSSFTFATNRNQVLDLGPLVRVTSEANYAATQYYMYGYEVGRPVSGLYGVQYAGTWKSQDEINQWAGSKYVSTPTYYALGRQRYIDANGDGVLSGDDEVYLGQVDPKYAGGMGNNFTYKGFELDFFIQYSLGAKMYNPIEFKQGTGYVGPNQFKYIVNRWHPINNPTSDIPRVNSQDFVATDRFVHDASFLRLGSLRFGYTFSKTNMPIKALQSLSFYITGTNLYLLTKYNGYDPDVSTDASSTVRRKDDGATPKNRTVAFSIATRF